jgi:hypothetical protein
VSLAKPRVDFEEPVETPTGAHSMIRVAPTSKVTLKIECSLF